MFENILELKKTSSLSPKAIEVVETVVGIALNADKERGLRLAAAFDLIMSFEYYGQALNSGWSYCPEKEPMMFYTYTNVCPRCLKYHKFSYVKANKLESGKIGMMTAELLCQMLKSTFKKLGKDVEVARASEPIDAIVFDKNEEKIIIAEVKSSPMLTIPLVSPCDVDNCGIGNEAAHQSITNPFFPKNSVAIYLPNIEGMQKFYEPLEVGEETEDRFYLALETLLTKKENFFNLYFSYWKKAFDAYSSKDVNCPLYWLTNGCGQPSPRPDDWPKRPGTGYESISDAKTSVGMDRTDDIKKAIYQVLKIGSIYKPRNPNIKTAIISNIHAVRHYDEYLSSVKDVIWAVDDSHQATLDGQLNPDIHIYNLFDGILSFTKSEIRDEWIARLFNFEV